MTDSLRPLLPSSHLQDSSTIPMTWNNGNLLAWDPFLVVRSWMTQISHHSTRQSNSSAMPVSRLNRFTTILDLFLVRVYFFIGLVVGTSYCVGRVLSSCLRGFISYIIDTLYLGLKFGRRQKPSIFDPACNICI